jgi:hypothetical protein
LVEVQALRERLLAKILTKTKEKVINLEKIMKKETGPLLWEAERIVEEAKGA